MSSIGSGIHVVDHVITQLPYALVCSAASLVGYVVLGLSRNMVLGVLGAVAALAVGVVLLRAKSAKVPSQVPEQQPEYARTSTDIGEPSRAHAL